MTETSPGNVTLERTFLVVCGALLVIGSLVFAWGGAHHPPTDTRLGPIGSDEFFRNFVDHIVRHGAWERIHTGILAGPVCWALGSSALGILLLERGGKRFGTLGLVALAMGAACWAVTFVFDGFVALRIAQAIAAASPGDQATLFPVFHANQVVVIRLGLVSWVLIGAGMAGLGIAGLAVDDVRSRAFRWIMGVAGLVVGLWPLLAWALGIFDPGPFISKWWAPTALLTAFWFLTMGVALMVMAARRRKQ